MLNKIFMIDEFKEACKGATKKEILKMAIKYGVA